MSPGAVGIGLRAPHFEALARTRPALGFLEVHAENFFGDGGPALAALESFRADYPVSLHGVGLSLGSAEGLDDAHLERLAKLERRVQASARSARMPSPRRARRAARAGRCVPSGWARVSSSRPTATS